MPTDPDRPRASLTPDYWVVAATEVLVDHGVDRVRVDLLARALKVTRGSFYWHFRDREDLLRAVLQAWRTRATEQLTRRLEGAHEDPREQVRDLISLPFRGRAAVRAARIELAIRAWARCDPMARAFVDEADAARVGYIAQVFSGFGFTIVEARARAFLLYAYELAESLVSVPSGPAQRDERARLVELLLLQPLPQPQPQPLARAGGPRPAPTPTAVPMAAATTSSPALRKAPATR
ncbi:MAG: TetR/AcrR family transcriptional regulator [Rubrivivax sp.]